MPRPYRQPQGVMMTDQLPDINRNISSDIKNYIIDSGNGRTLGTRRTSYGSRSYLETNTDIKAPLTQDMGKRNVRAVSRNTRLI